MKENLQRLLEARTKRHRKDPNRTPSAVLLPLFQKDGIDHILFIKRSTTVKDHKGQISFPGGRRDPEDASLRETALRECREEIGVPAEQVTIVGELDDFPTITSMYMVTPFVGVIPYPFEFKIDANECETIIEIPIEVLLKKASGRDSAETKEGYSATEQSYYYRGQVIWGATARILSQFLEIWLQAGES